MTRRTDVAAARPEVERAVLDPSGTVVSVNEAWERFARDNGGDPARTGVGTSFLAVCDAAGDDPVARLAASAVRAALSGELPAPLSMVIPCHSPHDQQWFDMLVAPRFDEERRADGATLELSPCLAPDEGSHVTASGASAVEVMVREHLRISDELHTQVVDRLFTLAMDVYGLAAAARDERTKIGLLAVVAGLDDVIVALRRSVFDLTRAPVPDLALRARLSETLDRAAAGTDLETTLALRGGVGGALSDRQALDVVDAVREGVAGAVRGDATAVAVRVGIERDEVVVEVVHDGADGEADPEPAPLSAGHRGGRWRESGPGGQGRRTRRAVRLERGGPTDAR